MKSRTALEILACTFAIGCGGGLFTGGSDDAGADVSSGGTGSGATGSGSGTSGTTIGTSGSGSSAVTGTGPSGTATTGVATTSASTTGAGGAVGTGGTGGSGFAGNGGTGGKTGAGGKAGAAGATGAGGTGGVGGSGSGGAGGGKAGAGGGTGKAGAGGAVDGGGVDWGACTGAGQCTAEITGCCPPCATPELDRFAGVNSKYVDAFRTATCPMPIPCPRCASFPNPYIGARCAGTRCQAFDVRAMPEISKCAGNNECRLRKGLDCCECLSLDDWTAVSVTGESALTSLVCAPMTIGCPACAPIPPANLQAVCNAGHCEVGGGGLGGP